MRFLHNHCYFLLLLLFCPIALLGQALPPNQPEQDCFNAIPVCQAVYVQNNSYQGEGLLDEEIPLETICLKCLRKEPDARYQSAGDLATDLARWLESKPIVARPIGRSERLWLWCRRRPAIAGLIMSLFMVVSLGSLVGWTMWRATYVDGLVESLLQASERAYLHIKASCLYSSE